MIKPILNVSPVFLLALTADAGAPPHLSSPPSAADFLTSLLRTSVCGSIQQTTSISSQSIQDVSCNSSQRWCCLRKSLWLRKFTTPKDDIYTLKWCTQDLLWLWQKINPGKNVFSSCVSHWAVLLWVQQLISLNHFSVLRLILALLDACFLFFSPPWNKRKLDEKTLVVFLLLWTEADQ